MEQLNKVAAVANFPDIMFKEIKTDITEKPDAQQIEPEQSAPKTDPSPIVSDAEIFNTASGFKAENDSSFMPRTDGATFTNSAQPFQPTAQPFQPSAQTTKAGQLVTGKFATDLMDSICPALIVYVAATVGYQARKSDLQLTADEKKTIAPAMQAYLDTVKIDFNNPLYNLLFVVGAIYGAKIIERAPDMQRKEKRAAPVKQMQQQTQPQPQTKEEKFEALVKKVMNQRKKGRADAINFIKKQQQKAA